MDKILYIIFFSLIVSNCSFKPVVKHHGIPFLEKNIWNGYPEEANAPYGIAKRIMHVQSESYKKQYNFNSIMLLLTNLYGPEDNFDKKSSHVIAALIRRFSEAKKNNYKEVIVWGDGKATRDFCYAEDVANGLVLAALITSKIFIFIKRMHLTTLSLKRHLKRITYE